MTMDMKRGKLFVGAVVAISLGSFAVPFGSIASASTGTGSAPQASRYIQLAQAEQSETEEKTERKVTESSDSPAVMAPGATVVAPGTTVIAPAAPVVTVPSTEEHVERKDVQKSTSTDALGMNSSSERRMDKSSTDVNPDGSVQQNEEHVTKEKIDNND
jgi:hypothetical protein